MSGFEYQSALSEIKKDISQLEKLSDAECKKALKECGNVYKKKVAAFSGGTEKFQGIGAGARVTVKKSKVSGYFLVVKGSKEYAKLWHLANNGFVHVGGTKVEGNFFVDKAQTASDSEVNQIIDDAVERISGEDK